MKNKFSIGDLSEIIQFAWADDAPFDAIKKQYGLSEHEVKKIMRRALKASSFRLWRKRMANRSFKHDKCDKIKNYRYFTVRKNPRK